jgi:hypothetical protein
LPLKWTISHAGRTVEAVASGTLCLQDIEHYLVDLMVSDALPYRKLFDGSQASSTLSDNDLMMLGARMSAYAGLGPIGPVAIVAPWTSMSRQAHLFATLAQANRPVKVFKTVGGGRKCRSGLTQVTTSEAPTG